MNYRAFFNSFKCRKYRVDIIADSGSTYTEIPLAADNPFVVNYNTSNTPFEPIRTSTATINIIYDKYLADALSSCAKGTRIELRDITNNNVGTIKWTGYLTPRVYDAGYTNCYETFSLEASDGLAALQYIDYTYENSGGITSVKTIIDHCMDAMEIVSGYRWCNTKKDPNYTNDSVYGTILPEHLLISEHNFTTNDTDEKWKCQDILAEICRYLGFTCLQYEDYIYFVDYQYLSVNNNLYAYNYPKYSNYTRTSNNASVIGSAKTISERDIMGAGHSISFEGIYNHIMVKDNLYAAEDFIPSPFEDNYLKNRFNPTDINSSGFNRNYNFYYAVEIPPLKYSPNLPSRVNQPPYVAMYPNGATVTAQQDYDKEYYKGEDKKVPLPDSGWTYMHRLYDNDYWESVYYNNNGVDVTSYLGSATTANSGITREWGGGTIVDMGVCRNAHGEGQSTFFYTTAQWIVPDKLDYTRYLCICTNYTNENHNALRNKPVYKLKDSWKPTVLLDDDSYLVLNFTALWERYRYRNYINPEWCNTRCKNGAMGVYETRYGMQNPKFRLHIGNKGWSSREGGWVTAGSSDDWFEPNVKWDADMFDYWNIDQSCLNNISWEDNLNTSGYKIPMSGMDVTEGVEFAVLYPQPIFYGKSGSSLQYDIYYDWNAYYWIKDLSLKCVQENQPEDGNEADLLYENNPYSNCSVNDLELQLKITTHKRGVKPSYSHMGYKRNSGDRTSFLSGITENAISALYQRPEENIIEKYWKQYSTPTRKITLELGMDFTPFQKTYGVDMGSEQRTPDHGYTQLGAEIDYRTDKQTITFIEKDKKNNAV